MNFASRVDIVSTHFRLRASNYYSNQETPLKKPGMRAHIFNSGMYGELSVRRCHRYSHIGIPMGLTNGANGELTVRRTSNCKPL
jgi:hypothetical protein